MSSPWADFTERIHPSPEASCWPVAPGAKECRNGHPISTRQMNTVHRELVDTSTGEVLTNAEGRRLTEAVQVPTHLATPRSFLDPTGMVKVACGCGLPVHPVSGEEASPRNVGTSSWMRVKVLDGGNHQGHPHPYPLPDWALEPLQ